MPRGVNPPETLLAAGVSPWVRAKRCCPLVLSHIDRRETTEPWPRPFGDKLNRFTQEK